MYLATICLQAVLVARFNFLWHLWRQGELNMKLFGILAFVVLSVIVIGCSSPDSGEIVIEIEGGKIFNLNAPDQDIVLVARAGSVVTLGNITAKNIAFRTEGNDLNTLKSGGASSAFFVLKDAEIVAESTVAPMGASAVLLIPQATDLFDLMERLNLSEELRNKIVAADAATWTR